MQEPLTGPPPADLHGIKTASVVVSPVGSLGRSGPDINVPGSAWASRRTMTVGAAVLFGLSLGAVAGYAATCDGAHAPPVTPAVHPPPPSPPSPPSPPFPPPPPPGPRACTFDLAPPNASAPVWYDGTGFAGMVGMVR